MRMTVPGVVAVVSLIAGCSHGPLDIEKVGGLSFTQDVNGNGQPYLFSWDIPAEEVRASLQHLVPRAPEYRRTMVSSSHEATLEYDGKEYSIVFSRVKQSNMVVLFTIRRDHYMLVEPYSREFYHTLATHEVQTPK